MSRRRIGSKEPYARVYASAKDHPRHLDAGLLANGLYFRALAYCADHLTDGLVPRAWLEAQGGKRPVKALMDAGLIVLEGRHYAVRDYLDANPSRGDVEGKREKWREKKRVSSPPDSPGERIGESRGDSTGDSSRKARNSVTQLEKENTNVEPTARFDQAQNALKATNVQRVFEEWIAVTGKTNRTVLDAKRRRLIDRALKTYPLDDVLDAVRGWRRSPHHRGENQTRTVYNDLELLLRDPAHIERFRDLERGEQRIQRRQSTADIVAAFNAGQDAA